MFVVGRLIRPIVYVYLHMPEQSGEIKRRTFQRHSKNALLCPMFMSLYALSSFSSVYPSSFFFVSFLCLLSCSCLFFFSLSLSLALPLSLSLFILIFLVLLLFLLPFVFFLLFRVFFYSFVFHFLPVSVLLSASFSVLSPFLPSYFS